jgi:hypothetical protein
VDPQLRLIQEVELSIGDPLVLRRTMNMKIVFASVQLGECITGAVKLGKDQLVIRRQEIAIIVVFISWRSVVDGSARD